MIRELAVCLRPGQKMMLIETVKLKNRPGIPVLLNIIPGLGIGSFVQGDTWAGIAQLALEIGGTFLQLMDFSADSYTTNYYVGTAMYAGGYLVGVVAPWVYSHKRISQAKSLIGLPSLSGGPPEKIIIIPLASFVF